MTSTSYDDDTTAGSSRGIQRMSSPEKWEIKQLIAAGVLDITDYPGFNEDTGVLPAEEDPGSDEDVDIELVEDEPAFLRGQTKLSMCHSPVKIVKVSGCFDAVTIFSTEETLKQLPKTVVKLYTSA